MLLIVYTVLLLPLFQSATTGRVYIVTPDDHYYPNTTCHHCHNLQHYLLNTTKYFTSNTQLLFLPGLHHLHTDLIIQNIHNISLIGNSMANVTMPEAVIQSECDISKKGMVFVNITNLTIANMIINHCQGQFPNISQAAVLIKECNNVVMFSVHIHTRVSWFTSCAVMVVNLVGNIHLSHITCHGIYLYCNVTSVYKTNSVVLINHYHLNTDDHCKFHLVNPLDVLVLQNSIVTLQISNMSVKSVLCTPANKQYMNVFHITGSVAVLIINCEFINNHFFGVLLLFTSSNSATLKFISCRFLNNAINFQLISVKAENCSTAQIISCVFQNNKNSDNIISMTNVNTTISSSIFHDNQNVHEILHLTSNAVFESGTLILQSVDFYNNSIRNSTYSYLIQVTNIVFVLTGNLHFIKNVVSSSLIQLGTYSVIIFNEGIMKFSENIAIYLIDFRYHSETISIAENTTLVFSKNHVCAIFGVSIMAFPPCIFQYFSNIPFNQRHLKDRNYLITFDNNYIIKGCYNIAIIPLTNCRWLPDSLFSNMLPLNVNKNFVKFVNKTDNYDYDTISQSNFQKTICFCKDAQHPDCNATDLGYLYAGQTLNIYLTHNPKRVSSNSVQITFESDVNESYISPCMIDATENLKRVHSKCTKVTYVIAFPTVSWCAIFLKITYHSDREINIFYIRQHSCPQGFVKTEGKCVCDPNLGHFGVLACNINDQTIVRPGNSWISATTHNSSFVYYISLHCYDCLIYSSNLKFSAPNSQCRFNRSSVLCGECQQGLSTTFSSSRCQRCSNMYLLLIVPFAIAGLLLVLMLFTLNLTVTDGTINVFILYVNITGISAPALFHEFTFLYTFTSLANLDLGIQTCFYNGMDDYAKMWLQLAFPFYLIFIATLLIITSRYSTTIQRLTAHRALPVLATLFLLSYTKILHTVSIVLFSYSTITQLPSGQSTLVWSVDANVPLLGVRFIILFITCLIIFLIQVPFTIILLFSRPLQRFHYINKFKPLLDAYQGPYKDSHYYWIGLQLMVRVVFLGISKLETHSNLTISNVIVATMCALTGIINPFNNTLRNHHELLLLLNLQILYIFVQHNSNPTTIHTVIAMAAVHFTLIVVYHIITYMYGGVIRNKIQQGVNTVMGRISKRSTVQSFQLNNVPEVTYNYREYREPLVAQN